MEQQTPQGEIILYQPDETVRLEVRLEDDTVWLTQAQMAELFQTTRNNVTLHIGNIFKEGELSENTVRKESLLTAADGKIFDAYKQIVCLVRQARQSVVLIDNYIDETTLTMLSKREAGVSATIYTRPLSQQQQLDLQRHNQQYAPIVVNICQHNHDRFLIIDNEVYVFGASLKDAGKKLFAYIKMQETTATDLINGIR